MPDHSIGAKVYPDIWTVRSGRAATWSGPRRGVEHDRRGVLQPALGRHRPDADVPVDPVCAAADGGGPLRCPSSQADSSSGMRVEPQYETDQFRASVAHLQPRQSAELGESGRDEFVVMVEEAVATGAANSSAANAALVDPL